MSSRIGRVCGALLVLAAAAIPGMLAGAGVWVARSETRWDYVVPRNDPSLSVGNPTPPWRLVDWLYGAVIEIGAFGAFVAFLVLAVALVTDSRHRAARIGVEVWALGVLAMSLYAAVLHNLNWREWHALLDADVDIPYHYEPLEAPFGAAVMLTVGLIPAAIAWNLRRGRRGRNAGASPTPGSLKST